MRGEKTNYLPHENTRVIKAKNVKCDNPKYEVIILNHGNIDHISNIQFKFDTADKALNFAEICWANKHQAVIWKSVSDFDC